MGQQQLLLLTLSIVIVGIAVAVGIDAYLENRRKAEADIVVGNLVRVAATAQEWKMKTAAFGGGSGAAGFEGVGMGLDRLGWATVPFNVTTTNPDTGQPSRETAQCYQPNLNSLYCPIPQLSGRRGAGQLFIYALSNLISPTGSNINSNEMNMIATAVVSGTNPSDIRVTLVR